MTIFDFNSRLHLGSAEQKKEYNARLFTRVAPRYDLITRVLSFGQDKKWKQEMVALLPPLKAPVCVDLACGTGDITLLLCDKYPDGAVTGIDVTPAMLEKARARGRSYRVRFEEGDMNALPFKSESIDIITGGYALRNSPDLSGLISELDRVLKPGGVAAFLDFSKSDNIKTEKMAARLLGFWTGLWGLTIHANPNIHRYIGESLKTYPTRRVLYEKFQEAGLKKQLSVLFLGGFTELLLLQKIRKR